MDTDSMFAVEFNSRDTEVLGEQPRILSPWICQVIRHVSVSWLHSPALLLRTSRVPGQGKQLGKCQGPRPPTFQLGLRLLLRTRGSEPRC